MAEFSSIRKPYRACSLMATFQRHVRIAVLFAVVAAIVLAPLSDAFAGRDRPEKRMAFQSTRTKARHSLKSEVKVKSEKQDEEAEETDAAASGTSGYSFSATGDSRSPHSARQLFKHSNP